MTKELYGSTANITGAGRGIGREVALHLADLGAAVAAADISLRPMVTGTCAEPRERRGPGALRVADHRGSRPVGSQTADVLEENELFFYRVLTRRSA